MKRFVKSASGTDYQMHPAFAELDNEAYRCGYDLIVKSDTDVSLVCNTDAEHMPKITLTAYRDNGVIYLDAELSFPKLSTKDLDYYDSVSYYISDKWGQVGKLVSSICKWHLDYNEWEDEEDE